MLLIRMECNKTANSIKVSERQRLTFVWKSTGENKIVRQNEGILLYNHNHHCCPVRRSGNFLSIKICEKENVYYVILWM